MKKPKNRKNMYMYVQKKSSMPSLINKRRLEVSTLVGIVKKRGLNISIVVCAIRSEMEAAESAKFRDMRDSKWLFAIRQLVLVVIVYINEIFTGNF